MQFQTMLENELNITRQGKLPLGAGDSPYITSPEWDCNVA